MICPFRPNGSLKEGFYRSEQSAVSSETYLSKDTVVQSRPIVDLPGWEVRMDILRSIPDPAGLLSASDCHWEESGDVFWIRYQRQDLPDSPSHMQNLDSRETARLFLETLPDILRTEALLRESVVSKELLLPLFRAPIRKVQGIRLVSDAIVRDSLRSIGFYRSVPLGPEGRGVLTHSDALIKNTIRTKDGYRLIDWEALGVYPASSTPAHAISWTLLRLPVENWEDFLGAALPPCLPMMETDLEEGRRAIYWQMMREILYWSGHKIDDWWDRSEALL